MHHFLRSIAIAHKIHSLLRTPPVRIDISSKINPTYSAIYDAEVMDASESIYPVKKSNLTSNALGVLIISPMLAKLS
jgi:hypothetical protein